MVRISSDLESISKANGIREVRTTLPIFYLSLENANDLTARNGQPWNCIRQVDIDTASISEDLGNGQYLSKCCYQAINGTTLSTIWNRNAYSFDKVLDLAKQNGVYLKLVVMEKNEQIENEIGYDGKAACSTTTISMVTTEP